LERNFVGFAISIEGASSKLGREARYWSIFSGKCQTWIGVLYNILMSCLNHGQDSQAWEASIVEDGANGHHYELLPALPVRNLNVYSAGQPHIYRDGSNG